MELNLTKVKTWQAAALSIGLLASVALTRLFLLSISNKRMQSRSDQAYKSIVEKKQ